MHARRTTRRGYTAVEVMMSVALLGVGAAGVMSMQKTAIRANVQARRIDLATSLARGWIERLRTDITAWTLPSASDANQNNVSRARFISDGSSGTFIDSGRAPGDEGWYLPDQGLSPPTGGTIQSPGFDVLGRDVALTSSDLYYCAHVKLDCLSRTATSSGVATTCSLLRVNVRVFWPKDGGAAPLRSYCSRDTVAAVQDATGSPYHFVYAVSALRQNVAP
mgnify:CR=1 FL=1